MGGITTINVSYGYGMTDREYSYRYRRMELTQPIENEIVLDALIEIDESYGGPTIIDND